MVGPACYAAVRLDEVFDSSQRRPQFIPALICLLQQIVHIASVTHPLWQELTASSTLSSKNRRLRVD
jgi:hypothetical protein